MSLFMSCLSITKDERREKVVKLYTIDCFNCNRLEDKLKENNITYEICKDRNIMVNLGLTHMPVLQINDNTFLNFKEAMKWINNQKEAM